jgi:nucleotide-binding universal stress UspA family protein
MYKNILVAFDNSETSRHALEEASQICLALNNYQLTVVHVNRQRALTTTPSIQGVRDEYVSLPRIDSGVYSGTLPVDTVPKRENTHEIIEDSVDTTIQHAKGILEPLGIKADYQVLDGHTVDNICGYAESTDTDLIIVGSSEKSGFKKFFLGSVSEDIMKSTDIDILIVK